MSAGHHAPVGDNEAVAQRPWSGCAQEVPRHPVEQAALRFAGQDFEVAVRAYGQPVPVGAVVLAAAAGGLAAYVLARLVGRTARPRRTFTAAVVTGLALSAIPPVRAATTVSTAVWLLVLHVVVAAVLVPPLAIALPSNTTVLR